MTLETPRGRRLLMWVGGGAGVIAAAITATGAFVVLREDAHAPPADARPLSAPTLLRDEPLRSGPGRDVAIVQRLTGGTRLQLIGRSADSLWLAVSPLGQGEVVGWLPLDAVGGGGDTGRLAVIANGLAPAGGATPARTPTFTPDTPDLKVASVFSRDNRLGVVIANVGAADFTARILVSVNGGGPQPIAVKSGEPLRSGAHVEYVLPTEYVQRRSMARVTVSSDSPNRGDPPLNDTLEVIVAPDQPNDLEINSATNAPSDGHLQVVIRNNSEIPIVGPATILARDPAGSNRLLGRQDVVLNLQPHATLTIDVPEATRVDFTKVRIQLQSDSLDDATPSNNVYPR